jgi:hypothetical protein
MNATVQLITSLDSKFELTTQAFAFGESLSIVCRQSRK